MFNQEFFNNNAQLSDDDALRLVNLRNAYNYPGAYMRKSSTITPYQLSPGIWAEPVHPQNNEVTDIKLDRYHANLLNSTDAVDNLLGTTSVIFWGFYSMGGLAPYRANLHLNGTGSKAGANPESVRAALVAARAQPDFGSAMGAIANLPQLGHTSFASKVISLGRPEFAGILDNRINKGLCQDVWSESFDIRNGIGNVLETRYQQRYTRWCTLLCSLKEQLNNRIAHGNTDLRWQEQGVFHKWRAIDIERAIFRHYD